MKKHFFDTLRDEMNKKGWDLRKLVDEAGLDKTDQGFTTGFKIGHPAPRFDEVVKIADTLDISLDIFRKDYTEQYKDV